MLDYSVVICYATRMTDDSLIDCLTAAGLIPEEDVSQLKSIMGTLPNQEWMLLKLLVALKIAELQ